MMTDTEELGRAASKENINNVRLRRCRISAVQAKNEPWWWTVGKSNYEIELYIGYYHA